MSVMIYHKPLLVDTNPSGNNGSLNPTNIILKGA